VPDPDPPTHPPTEARLDQGPLADDRAYVDAMESRRAQSLKRRVFWACIIVMFLMAISVLGESFSILGLPINADESGLRTPPNAADVSATTVPAVQPVYPSTWVLFTSSGIAFLIALAVMIYTLRTRPYSAAQAAVCGGRTGRHRLVVALTWLSLGTTVICVPAEMIAQWADVNAGPPGAVAIVYNDPMRAGYTAANGYGVLFLVACVLVPMRWRESARIALPALGVLLASILLLLVPERWQSTLGFMLMALAYTVAGMAWSAWRFADFDARLRAHALGARYTDLHGQVSEISAELKEARRLHESLFPAPSVNNRGPVCVEYRYQPARHIGGDFLFVHREPPSPPALPGPDAAPSAATIVVIDVSGHGVAAALAVNRLHGELLRFFSHYPRVEREAGGPGHLLADLNTYACAALAPQGVYATALIVRIDPASGRANWASAGHPTGFLLRSSAAGPDPVADLPSTATMLGVLPPELFDADEQTIPMSAGDTLLAYTDGAVESRDARGQDFTPERLRSVLADLARHPSRRPLIDVISNAVEAHRHGRITDDTLLVEIDFRSVQSTRVQMAQTAVGHPAPA